MNAVSWARYWSCERKRRYYGKREAFRAADSASKRSGKEHRIYRCDFGDHWHITHRKKEQP